MYSTIKRGVLLCQKKGTLLGPVVGHSLGLLSGWNKKFLSQGS